MYSSYIIYNGTEQTFWNLNDMAQGELIKTFFYTYIECDANKDRPFKYTRWKPYNID